MSTLGPILIVDDEADLLDMVDITLRREGFHTVLASDGTTALELARSAAPSAVLLDLMLPDLSGVEVCRRLRSDPVTADIPIIMLTARGEEIDRVVGFEVGADDYVVKANLSMRELALRVRAVVRRRPGGGAEAEPASQRMVFQDLVIDQDEHRVWIAGEEIVLTATEFKLLIALAGRAGRVQTRGTLLQDVWDMAPDLNTRTVDTHVKRLREKLGDAAGHVETVRGVGYRFSPTRSERR